MYDKSYKGFKEKDAVQNAWDGVVKVITFIFILTLLFHFLKLTYLFGITLVPGVPILYPQYHLILSIADFHTRETGN